MCPLIFRTFQSSVIQMIIILFTTSFDPGILLSTVVSHKTQSIMKVEAPKISNTEKDRPGRIGRTRKISIFILSPTSPWALHLLHVRKNIPSEFNIPLSLGRRPSNARHKTYSPHKTIERHNYFTSFGPTLFNITPKRIKAEIVPALNSICICNNSLKLWNVNLLHMDKYL